jgi:hypothetical protein
VAALIPTMTINSTLMFAWILGLRLSCSIVGLYLSRIQRFIVGKPSQPTPRLRSKNVQWTVCSAWLHSTCEERQRIPWTVQGKFPWTHPKIFPNNLLLLCSLQCSHSVVYHGHLFRRLAFGVKITYERVTISIFFSELLFLITITLWSGARRSGSRVDRIYISHVRE